MGTVALADVHIHVRDVWMGSLEILVGGSVLGLWVERTTTQLWPADQKILFNMVKIILRNAESGYASCPEPKSWNRVRKGF